MGTQYSVDQRRSLRRLGAGALVLGVLGMLALGCRAREAPGTERNLAPARPTDAALVEANVNSESPEQQIRQLDDPDERVRVKAVAALHAMNHPAALQACLKTLDDAPDSLHSDRTPAVRCLIEIGRPALAPLLDVLAAPSATTRLHAQRAVEGITRRMHGFDGKAWTGGTADDWIRWWGTIGYAHDGPDAARAAAIDRLRAWTAGAGKP